MAHCKYCAKGNHQKCLKENGDKLTGCPACCQHRETTQVQGPNGEVYTAPAGVTGLVING